MQLYTQASMRFIVIIAYDSRNTFHYYISAWAHRGPHAPPPPPMIHHEWYQIVQWTLRKDLSDVKLVHAPMAVILLNDHLTAPENH